MTTATSPLQRASHTPRSRIVVCVKFCKKVWRSRLRLGFWSARAPERSSWCAMNFSFCHGCELSVGFALISQGFHVQVAVRLDPPLVDLHGQSPDQPQAAGLVGEDADDVCASLELLVDPLEHVGALEVFVVLARQTVKRPGLLDVALHPLAQPRILRLPAPQPGRQIPPRLLGRAPVVKPAQLQMREDGVVRSRAVQVAIGIDWEGRRQAVVVGRASRIRYGYSASSTCCTTNCTIGFRKSASCSINNLISSLLSLFSLLVMVCFGWLLFTSNLLPWPFLFAEDSAHYPPCGKCRAAKKRQREANLATCGDTERG